MPADSARSLPLPSADTQHLLAGVDALEQQIGDTLGVPAEGAGHDVISDLVADVGTLDGVLAQFGIQVDE